MTEHTKQPKSHQSFQAVFAALADPSRRDVLAVLADGGELSVSEVRHRMRQRLSPTMVSRHLAVLREAGIVYEEPGYHPQRRLKLQLASKWMIEQAFASLLTFWTGPDR